MQLNPDEDRCPNCGRPIENVRSAGAFAVGRIPSPEEHREHGDCSCGAKLTRTINSPWFFDRPRQFFDYPELLDCTDEELSEAYKYLQPGDVLTPMQGEIRLSRCLEDADNPRVTEARVIERVRSLRENPDLAID